MVVAAAGFEILTRHRQAPRTPQLPISATSSARFSRYTGRTPEWASVLEEQYQSRSAPPGPQPSRPYSPMVISVYVVSSVRVTFRNWRRIGSCQQTSGLVSRKSRP